MATKRIKVLPQAKFDFDEESVYLAREASAEVGIRFFDAVQDTFQSLLEMPGMGKLKPISNPVWLNCVSGRYPVLKST